MIRTLLVPLDGSRFGEHALPLALTVARKANARVHLVHSHQRLDSPYAEMQVFDETLDGQMRSRETTYLDYTVGRVKEVFPDGYVTAKLLEGHVATELQKEARDVGADLIVMTTHARGVMARFWLGSVTDELLRHSPVPLLLAHPQDQPPDLSREVPLKRWLIPLDGTPEAEQILPPALAVAEPFHPMLHLFRVVRPVLPVLMPLEVGSFGAVAQDMVERVEELQKQVENQALTELNQVAMRLVQREVRSEAELAVEEQPGVAILERAKSGIDIIALGTHGRRGLRRMFLGSVADKVIRGAHVPVLVDHPHPREAPVGR